MTPHARLLVVAAALIVVAEGFVNDGDAAAWAGLSAWGIALAALLLFVVLPRVDRRGWPILAVSFGVTALLTCVAFWSALPFAFGVAAIAASDGRRVAPGTILGAISMVIALVFCIVA